MRETRRRQASLPGDHRALEPPDSIPNSVVKRCIADGSVGSPHVRVGHRQALNTNAPISYGRGVLRCALNTSHKGRPAFIRVGPRCAGPPPVRVGHRQALNTHAPIRNGRGVLRWSG